MELQKYPKFKSKEECAYPERNDCNYGENYDRCPYMKYNNSKSIFDSTRWECTYKITKNTQNNQKLPKENEEKIA